MTAAASGPSPAPRPEGWPRVAVVLVNWNGWADTIECLESVFRCDYRNYQVIVCDNGSEDGSLRYIPAWADGQLDVAVSPRHPLRELTFPPAAKPISFRLYDRRSAEAGGDDRGGDSRLILIDIGANLGFAGGVNVGLRFAAASHFEYVWLLNNDTVVKPDALRRLVERGRARADIGHCGSTLLYYDAPQTVQALGGARYSKWLGATWPIGGRRPMPDRIEVHRVERHLAYIIGASMLVPLRFVEDVGLMSEEYFLFFEELDWALRRGSRYTLAYAADSIVYHKEGASIGTSPDARRRSLLAEWLLITNRLRLTWKFHPLALPTVYLGVVASFVKRLWEGEWAKARLIADILIGRVAQHAGGLAGRNSIRGPGRPVYRG